MTFTGASITSFRLRATRAAPPGLARTGERRQTYGAALAQFDELMAAAGTATPASRPLPLFYALSQAGRAIAAVHGETHWRLRGHGLACPRLEGDVLNVAVRRLPTKAKASDISDSFTGVGAATGSKLFVESATLGELWASLPELFELLPAEAAKCWPCPLRLIPEGIQNHPVVPWGRVDATLVGYGGEPDALVEHLHARYPTAATAHLFQPQRLPHQTTHTPFGTGVMVSFEADRPDLPGHLATLERVAPGGSGFEARWLRPAVGGVALHPLMTWWAFLFGLSMLARYEPAGWTAALALDSSPLAAPLAQCLDIAIERVPELVLDAIAVDER